MFKRFIASLVCFAFIFTNFQYVVQAQDFSINQLPVPGSMISTTPAYVPLTLKGLIVHPENALKFDFLMDTGHSNLKGQALSDEALKIMKYFLTALTIPEDDLWVNLSPYEKGRIIQDNFGQTIMGRDLLAEDYVLKQLTASLIYPEKALGKEFWQQVYSKAAKEYGTTQIPVNTFNKVWIVPSEAVVWEHEDKVLIVKSHLKVMLEEDYLSLNKHTVTPQNDMHALGSRIVRTIVLPVLEKEVNEGKNFAQLRQMYQAMILATWYKKSLRESILNKVYADQKKTKGVNDINSGDVETIYQQYLKAFKRGAFNYIKEDIDPATGQTVPRKYFSGGFSSRVNGTTKLVLALGIWLGNMAQLSAAQKAYIKDAIGNTGTMELIQGDFAEITQIHQSLAPRDSAMVKAVLASQEKYWKAYRGLLRIRIKGYIKSYVNDPNNDEKDLSFFIKEDYKGAIELIFNTLSSGEGHFETAVKALKALKVQDEIIIEAIKNASRTATFKEEAQEFLEIYNDTGEPALYLDKYNQLKMGGWPLDVLMLKMQKKKRDLDAAMLNQLDRIIARNKGSREGLEYELGEYFSNQTVKTLMELLQYRNEIVKEQIIVALGNKGDIAIEPLLEILNDRKLASYAAEALLKINGYKNKVVLGRFFRWYQEPDHQYNVQGNVFQFLNEAIKRRSHGYVFNINWEPAEGSKYRKNEQYKDEVLEINWVFNESPSWGLIVQKSTSNAAMVSKKLKLIFSERETTYALTAGLIAGGLTIVLGSFDLLFYTFLKQSSWIQAQTQFFSIISGKAADVFGTAIHDPTAYAITFIGIGLIPALLAWQNYTVQGLSYLLKEGSTDEEEVIRRLNNKGREAVPALAEFYRNNPYNYDVLFFLIKMKDKRAIEPIADALSRGKGSFEMANAALSELDASKYVIYQANSEALRTRFKDKARKFLDGDFIESDKEGERLLNELLIGHDGKSQDHAMLVDLRLNVILSLYHGRSELDSQVEKFLAEQSYDTLLRLSEHDNIIVRKRANITLERYKPVIEELKERQPVGAFGSLLDSSVEKAFRWWQQGHDFVVVYEPSSPEVLKIERLDKDLPLKLKWILSHYKGEELDAELSRYLIKQSYELSVKLLNHHSLTVRYTALVTLGKLADQKEIPTDNIAIPALIFSLSHGQSFDHTIEILEELGASDKQLFQGCKIALLSENEETVEKAVDALGEMGNKAAKPLLLELYKKENSELNTHIDKALDKINYIERLKEYLAKQDKFALVGLLKGNIDKLKLLDLDFTGLNPILDPNNTDEDSIWMKASATEIRLKSDIYLKEEYVHKIAKDNFYKIWPIIGQALKYKDKFVRKYIVDRLVELGGKDVIEILSEMLKDEKEDIVLSSIKAGFLKLANKEQIFNAYTGVLSSKNSNVSGNAAKEIRYWGWRDEAIKFFLGRLSDDLYYRSAENALENLGASDEEVSNGYMMALSSKDAQALKNAKNKLGISGDVTGFLLKMLKEEDDKLRNVGFNDFELQEFKNKADRFNLISDVLHTIDPNEGNHVYEYIEIENQKGYIYDDKTVSRDYEPAKYLWVKQPRVDSAMIGQSIVAKAPKDLGGISLDAAMLNLQIKRDGNGVPLPISEQPLDKINIQGFVPQIISIQPVDLRAVFNL